jgi:putative glycerol-1-phosphate prenyltransferase|tara:strand:- start:22004 stop:22726 length:723 start_codon:yes stop_codon:yes gene_type:complete
MEKGILQYIVTSKKQGRKLLAILLDPDKLSLDEIPNTIEKINNCSVDFIFVGGSTVEIGTTDLCVSTIKNYTKIRVILFPGDYTQLTHTADAVLFLSLVSGRNPEYLIEQQVRSVDFLKISTLEIIPTGYILIDGGVETATQRVSNTLPLLQTELEKITNTALASQFMGKDLVYLEAGSGATEAVEPIIIKQVSNAIDIPLIVGGGIRTKKQLNNAYNAGADFVVIGTAFEEDNEFLDGI